MQSSHHQDLMIICKCDINNVLTFLLMYIVKYVSSYNSYIFLNICFLLTRFSEEQAKNLMSSFDVTQLNELKGMEIHRNRAKDESSEKYLDSNKQNYFCPDCGESFSNISSLSAHAEALNHASVEESCWICGLCSNAFLREDELTRHMKVHEDFMADSQLPAQIQGEEVAVSDIVQNECLNRIVQVSTLPYNQDTVIGSHRHQSFENGNVTGMYIYQY